MSTPAPTTRRTLAELADMLNGPYYDNNATHFVAHSWIHGALSIIAHRTIHKPAFTAVKNSDAQWREWGRNEAVENVRELAKDPGTDDAALQAARQELEDTRQALGLALGIHPASHYSLREMIGEVARRVPESR